MVYEPPPPALCFCNILNMYFYHPAAQHDKSSADSFCLTVTLLQMSVTYTSTRQFPNPLHFKVGSASSSAPRTRSIVASCGVTDLQFSLSILGRSIACVMVNEPDILTWRCDFEIIAKLFHDFDHSNSVPTVAVVGCGADCNTSHSGQGNCLVCGSGWGNHGGHRCRSGTRGSWPTGPVPAEPAQAAPSVLTPMRMHGMNGLLRCLFDQVKSFYCFKSVIFTPRRVFAGSCLRANRFC